MPAPHLVVLALGANLDEPLARLEWAIRELVPRLEGARRASLYRSHPLPTVGPPQPDYLNTVVVGHSRRSSREWLATAKSLELRAGRRPSERWGPRVLDIDLILVGTEERQHRDLVLPHAGLSQRLFVLAPLAELAPNLEVPGLARTVAELERELAARVEPIERL